MKKIVWLAYFILSLAIAGIAYGDTAADIATGVSTESLSRIRIGMSIDEVEQIIGREADSVFEFAQIFTVPGFDIPPNFHHVWYGEYSSQITVVFHDDSVLQTRSAGLEAASNHHVSAGAPIVNTMGTTRLGATASPAPTPSFWETQGGVWFMMFGVIVVLALIYGLYVMYNQTKPEIKRDVRVIARRVRHHWWGRHNRPAFLLTFSDVQTGEQIEKALPMGDRELFDYVNIGDEGILTTQGALYISFIRTKILGN